MNEDLIKIRARLDEVTQLKKALEEEARELVIAERVVARIKETTKIIFAPHLP